MQSLIPQQSIERYEKEVEVCRLIRLTAALIMTGQAGQVGRRPRSVFPSVRPLNL